MVDRSVAPALTPTFSYLSDSEENRIQSIAVAARWQVADPLQIAVNVARRELEQGGRPELSNEVLAVDAVVTTRATSGWGLSGGVGVWQPSARTDDRITTMSAAVLSPPWWVTRADLTFARTAYDVTAQAAEVNVEVREVRLDANARLGARASVSALASAARFRGNEIKDRMLGAARFSYRFLPWLFAGPGVQAFTFEESLDDVYWDPKSYAVFELPVAFGPTEGAFLPRLEVAPGYQHTDGAADPWSASVRVQGRLLYNLSPQRQIGVSALFSNSGFSQLSSVGDPDYRAHGVSFLFSWAF
jgi:hypothetical protein